MCCSKFRNSPGVWFNGDWFIGRQYRAYTRVLMTQDRVSNYPHWIGGKPVAGISGRAGDVFNPSLGLVAARVALASEAEADAAVQAEIGRASCREGREGSGGAVFIRNRGRC